MCGGFLMKWQRDGMLRRLLKTSDMLDNSITQIFIYFELKLANNISVAKFSVG